MVHTSPEIVTATPATKRVVQATLLTMWKAPGSEAQHVQTGGGKRQKSKSTNLTDAQRAAWAHAHYIIHHGTQHDAVRLLQHAASQSGEKYPDGNTQNNQSDGCNEGSDMGASSSYGVQQQ